MQANEKPPVIIGKSVDDALSLASLGILAFVLADVTHEALGHGLATLAVGAKPGLLTTCYLSTSGSLSRWIPAAGGIANGIAGLLSLLILRLSRTEKPHLRLFLVLAIAFNLLFAAAYPFYSGIAAFGDWAAVISGLSPPWLWRGLLIACSLISYYLSLWLLAIEIRPFCGLNSTESLNRLRRITLIPFLAALAAAALGGALNPAGWSVIFTSAIPAAAAAFGLTQLDHFPHTPVNGSSLPAGAIPRSIGWILAAVVILALFVGVLGPGVKFGPNS